MSLFDRIKKLAAETGTVTNEFMLVAPVSGEIVSLDDVPDVVFAQRIVGDGLAIKPAGNKLVAPANGTISKIFPGNNAFLLTTDAGIEVFTQFGIDTHELNGVGFQRIAAEGSQVVKGDTIIEFDLDLLTKTAKSTLTPVVITNMDKVSDLVRVTGFVVTGFVVAGESSIFLVHPK